MDKKMIGIEAIKIIILTLVLVTLLLIYSELNTIHDSFQSVDKDIKNLKTELSNNKNIENRIQDAYSTSIEKAALRDGMLSNAVNIAAMSQQYFRKPLNLGGGANSFKGFTIPGSLQKTKNGSFKVVIVNNDSIKIIGVGNTIGSDGKKPIRIELDVNPKNIVKTIIIN